VDTLFWAFDSYFKNDEINRANVTDSLSLFRFFCLYWRQRVAVGLVQHIYTYASVLIFLPWAMMMFAPNKRYTEPFAFMSAIALLIAGAYCTFQFIKIGSNSGEFQSVVGVFSFFRNKEMLLSGWFNYLSISLLAVI
jgi:Domain of unknown function (DUF4281)